MDRHFVPGLVIVLIETYWNVNPLKKENENSPLFVLIETYWNVNKEYVKMQTIQELSLNRNILECK